jgi:thiol-disulfide isomerase/thioredoxin
VRCIHLWATWCGPCRSELPELDAVAQAFAGKVDTFLIAVSDNAQRVDSLIRAKRIQSPVLLDPHGALLALLNTSAVPTTVCTDAAGYILELKDPQPPYLEQNSIGGPRLWNSPHGIALFESVGATPPGSTY